ncbi:prepilin peptidase [Salinispira pacifica]|uniref:Prepilin type IV endopeptidase peptidase domain-containing protein n=1 Tax=Salinispira pacifica TaxID=1307761 RepID=V5WCN6_9SPIO|nr:A24 family peptidase [Salinispira pacifica]AHC13553.1 hypothetical protein L21SP2_0109 [Salinispira pacifica]
MENTAGFGFVILLLEVCAARDVREQIIPDTGTLLFFFPGLLYAVHRTPGDMLQSIVLAGAIVWFTAASARVFPGSFGWGDGKLLTALALSVPAATWYRGVLGCCSLFLIHGVFCSLKYGGRRRWKSLRGFAAPVGPYLLAGFLLMPLWVHADWMISSIVFDSIV